MTRPAQAVIDLSALQHNLNKVRECAPSSRVMAVIKANAYGHGMSEVARALSPADAFGVASLEEALQLRATGILERILLLEGLFSAEELQLAFSNRLDIVIHTDLQLEMLVQAAPDNSIDVWLKIDTGMHRLGFSPAELPDIFQKLQSIDVIENIRYMTHFACADEVDNQRTPDQLKRFRDCMQAVSHSDRECSLANSAAIIAWPEAHFDWVRPGIMLYGSSPFVGKSADELGLLPVMTLRTELIALRQCAKGEAVGYGSDWLCPEDMSIGIAAIGYGDGYPRHAPSGTPVLVDGKRASLAGRVSMDMIAVDLRAVPAARIGSDVTLWGTGLSVDDVAAAAGTLSYELLCNVGARVPRVVT